QHRGPPDCLPVRIVSSGEIWRTRAEYAGLASAVAGAKGSPPRVGTDRRSDRGRGGGRPTPGSSSRGARTRRSTPGRLGPALEQAQRGGHAGRLAGGVARGGRRPRGLPPGLLRPAPAAGELATLAAD